MVGPSSSSTVENLAVLELRAALAPAAGAGTGFPSKGDVGGVTK